MSISMLNDHTSCFSSRRALLATALLLFIISNFDWTIGAFEFLGIEFRLKEENYLGYFHFFIVYFLIIFLIQAYGRYLEVSSNYNNAIHDYENVSNDYDIDYYVDVQDEDDLKHNTALEHGLDVALKRKRSTGQLYFSFIFIEFLPALVFLAIALYFYFFK